MMQIFNFCTNYYLENVVKSMENVISMQYLYIGKNYAKLYELFVHIHCFINTTV